MSDDPELLLAEPQKYRTPLIPASVRLRAVPAADELDQSDWAVAEGHFAE